MESTLRRAAGTPGLALIETMLWQDGAISRLELHLERLAASAETLGWNCPLDEIRVSLTQERSAAPLRLRLTLDAKGQWEITHAPLAPTPAFWRIGLASARLQSDDPWLTVKSSNRSLYDRGRAALPYDLDELIFVNERGEVCEGCITSVFFDKGQGMRTPPLASGVLPGVLRRALNVPEERLLLRELDGVTLWVGNALRGLIAARWSAKIVHVSPPPYEPLQD